jgi:stearoyl-CoA desaturase (delta-9 desaturase)
MKRVGILHGGHPQALDEKKIPPALRLRIARYGEMGNLSSSAFSDDGEDVLD